MRRQAKLCEPAPDLITGVNWDEAWMSRQPLPDWARRAVGRRQVHGRTLRT